MRRIILAVLLGSTMLLASEIPSPTSTPLAFGQGSANLAVGALIGFRGGSGFGIPVVFDYGAFNNMFSIGGDVHFWWNPYTYEHEDTREWTDGASFGIAPTFRFGFHPFGMPALVGKIRIAKEFDPYVLFRFGFSAVIPGKNDRWWRDTSLAPSFSPFVTGMRWFFKPNLALWAEIDWRYSAVIGINFKF